MLDGAAKAQWEQPIARSEGAAVDIFLREHERISRPWARQTPKLAGPIDRGEPAFSSVSRMRWSWILGLPLLRGKSSLYDVNMRRCLGVGSKKVSRRDHLNVLGSVGRRLHSAASKNNFRRRDLANDLSRTAISISVAIGSARNRMLRRMTTIQSS